jgi:hypothetical protein
VNDVERALSEIAEIRARISASSRFQGLGPEAMAFGGALAFAVALAQTVWRDALASSGPRYVAVWTAAMLCSCAVCVVEAMFRCRSLHGSMASAMLSGAVRQLMPFGAAGLVIAVVICSVAPGAAWAVPGLWQILTALAGFSIAATLPRAITLPSAWYFFCGVLVLGLAGLKQAASPWMMGVPFAIGQTMVAVVLARGGKTLP